MLSSVLDCVIIFQSLRLTVPLFVVSFLLLRPSRLGAYGVDQSSLISQSSFSCMRSKGYSFGVSRIFMEVCRVDSAGAQTVANAWAAGFAHMDVRNTGRYMRSGQRTQLPLPNFQLANSSTALCCCFFLPLVCLLDSLCTFVLNVPALLLVPGVPLPQLWLRCVGCWPGGRRYQCDGQRAVRNSLVRTRKEKHMHEASDHDRQHQSQKADTTELILPSFCLSCVPFLLLGLVVGSTSRPAATSTPR